MKTERAYIYHCQVYYYQWNLTTDLHSCYNCYRYIKKIFSIWQKKYFHKVSKRGWLRNQSCFDILLIVSHKRKFLPTILLRRRSLLKRTRLSWTSSFPLFNSLLKRLLFVWNLFDPLFTRFYLYWHVFVHFLGSLLFIFGLSITSYSFITGTLSYVYVRSIEDFFLYFLTSWFSIQDAQLSCAKPTLFFGIILLI